MPQAKTPELEKIRCSKMSKSIIKYWSNPANRQKHSDLLKGRKKRKTNDLP